MSRERSLSVGTIEHSKCVGLSKSNGFLNENFDESVPRLFTGTKLSKNKESDDDSSPENYFQFSIEDDSKSNSQENQNRQSINSGGKIETINNEGIVSSYLLENQIQKVPVKNFEREIRAVLDIEDFIKRPVVLLDVVYKSLESVIDEMLKKIFTTADNYHSLEDEIKSALFVSTSSKLELDHLLSNTLHGTENVSLQYDESWFCTTCNISSLQRRQIAIARLKYPSDIGNYARVRFIILILCPSQEKATKNAEEIGRTFGTMFLSDEFRQNLVVAPTESEFLNITFRQCQYLMKRSTDCTTIEVKDHEKTPAVEESQTFFRFGTGIMDDLKRRLPHYISDYTDGITGPKTISKTTATTVFLYFAIILPVIAFGVLNDHNTHGIIDVKKGIFGQAIGGLIYVIFCGQPLSIVMTTAPLCLFVKVIYSMASDFDVEFQTLYCLVGLWSSFFTISYALLDVSRIMKWSTRSTEEIFALFITVAFFVDASKNTFENFSLNYNSPSCKPKINHNENITATEWNSTSGATCQRDSSVLFLLLMFLTLWFGLWLYKFSKTKYFKSGLRETISDYSLPISVLGVSAIGSLVFHDIHLESFKYDNSKLFNLVSLSQTTLSAIACSAVLGFLLSLLILMDQNISSAMVNNPSNNLKKGAAYHWDLIVIAIINLFLSIFTFPFMHAALPHCPLHMRHLADFEDRVQQSHVYQVIVRCRETRLTGLFSHILIGLSLFLLPYPLRYIPTAVLNGLFLYMAITALDGNQMFQRINLIFTEQVAYPPSQIVRLVPQRKIHQFTCLQLIQLLVLCVIGFFPNPYVQMMFPVILLTLLPVRHKVVPRIINEKHMATLDGENLH